MYGTCVGLIIIVVFLLLWIQQNIFQVFGSRSEYLENIAINTMTDNDIEMLRQHIEKAVHAGQFYSNFRRIYPYEVTPWQYKQLVIARKRGLLDNARVKAILIESGSLTV